MKTKICAKFLSVILFGVFMSGSTVLMAQKTNFSGSWNFNEGKSQMGEGRFRMPAPKLTITQDETTLSMEKNVKGRNGEEMTLKEKYTLDGKVCENAGFMNTVKKSTVVWSADNKSITISSTSVFERDGNSMEIKTTEIYSLSEDGKTLTINTTNTSQRGERKQILTYDKAN